MHAPSSLFIRGGRRLRKGLQEASHRQVLAGIVGVVLASRAFLYALGVRFYDHELDRYMPFLDVELLRSELLQSVWYLHLKPPAMNVGVGLVLQWAGDASTVVFAVLFVGLGVLLAVSLADVLWQLGVPRWGILLLSLGYAVSPPVLLFENFLLHTYPAAALVTAVAASFGRALSSSRPAWWGICFTLGMLLCYTRSLYHLVWLLGILALALFLQWAHRRRILYAAALPTTAVLALYAKNLLLFGFFGASSWLGISLAKGTVHHLPAETRTAWIQEGPLTPIAQVDPFAGPAAYRPYVDEPPPTGIPALDRLRKASGAPNYNHRIYPPAARAQLRNALATIQRNPVRYAETVRRDLLHWLSPATTWHPREPDGSPFQLNRSVLGSYERAVNAILHVPVEGYRVGMALLIPLLLGLGGAWGLRDIRRGKHVRGGLRLLLVGTGLYVAAVSCLVETGPELSRFRFTVDALLLALAASLLFEWVHSFFPRS